MEATAGAANARAVYLTPAEAASTARVSPRTLARWLASGKLPASKLGRIVRIDRAELDRLLGGAAQREAEAESREGRG